MILTAEELQVGDVAYVPFSNHPDDVIVIDSVRPDKGWDGHTVTEYHYLGSAATFKNSWRNGEPFERLTTMGVLA